MIKSRKKANVDLKPSTPDDEVVQWLLAGDPAIRWQTMRDLCGLQESAWKPEQRQVAEDGWGTKLLRLQRPDGHWGRGAYQPKWTCTTYTLQLLRQLGLASGHPAAIKACRVLLDEGQRCDGGIDFSTKRNEAEVCITGMVLAACGWFRLDEDRVDGLAEWLLGQQLTDGGFNCLLSRGATHSSVHTTISVLEGLREYVAGGRTLSREAEAAASRAREFLLIHQLFRSHRTGRVIHSAMTRFPFPPHWHYDVLRALDYFASCSVPPDRRAEDAVHLVLSRRRSDGRWPLHRGYPGAQYFQIEKAGAASRWNTLRALRVLAWWGNQS